MQIALRIDRYHIALIALVTVSLLYNISLYHRQSASVFSVDFLRLENGDETASSLEENEPVAKLTEGSSEIAKKTKILKEGFANIITFSAGDTLYKILGEMGVANTNCALITTSINKIFKLSSIKVGEQVEVTAYDAAGAQVEVEKNPHLLIVNFQDKKIELQYNPGAQSYKASLVELPTTSQNYLVYGAVQNSFFGTAKKNGLSASLASEFVRVFSYDVDFQRDVNSGTKFKVLYSAQVNEKGKKVKDGKIIYAALNVKGREIEIYRHEFPNGSAGYFYKDGTSIKKALLKTPIKGAVISSGYGVRKHPILGYSKVHRGLDYAAPKGTPILAAGDGIIESAKIHSSYGKYIKIKHNQKYATLYAHLDKFSTKLKAGDKVKQGDVIGYVGSTGLSTGSHLHYEVHIDGKQVNPAKVTIMSNAFSLSKQQLVSFRAQQQNVDKILQNGSYASALSTVHKNLKS